MSLANIKISNNKNYAFKDIKNYLVENFLYNNETDCINTVSYTHLTLPTNREV